MRTHPDDMMTTRPQAYKALSHGAIFLATCNEILLLRDVT